LDLGDAVAEEAPDPVGALEDGHPVTGARELLGRGEPGRPGADDGHGLAGTNEGRLGDDPARVEGAVDDGELDGLDGDGVVVDPENAGPLAGRGTEGPRELREVVGRVEAVDRLPEVVVVDEVVPVGDQVAERAPLVAKGNAAVHAARSLAPERVSGPREHHLPPVAESFSD